VDPWEKLTQITLYPAVLDNHHHHHEHNHHAHDHSHSHNHNAETTHLLQNDNSSNDSSSNKPSYRCIGKRQLAGASDGNDIDLHIFESAADHRFDLKELYQEVMGVFSSFSHQHSNSHEHSHDHHHLQQQQQQQSDCCDGTNTATATAATTTSSSSSSPSSPSSASSPPPSCCASGTCMASFLPPELLVTQAPTVTPKNGDHVQGDAVRSTISCTQICCSSEIPHIHNVLDPLAGVAKIMINVPLKQVSVDHYPDVLTAQDMEDALNKAGFGATIKRDGGVGSATGTGTGTGTTQDRNHKGRSQLYVEKICCSSEIPAINTILLPIQGVSHVSINVTTKMVRYDMM
jgi:copper chaperone CopZ